MMGKFPTNVGIVLRRWEIQYCVFAKKNVGDSLFPNEGLTLFISYKWFVYFWELKRALCGFKMKYSSLPH